MTFWQFRFLNNSVEAWVGGALVTLLTLAAFSLLRHVLVRRFARPQEAAKAPLGELLGSLARRTECALLAVPAVYLGAQALTLPGQAGLWLKTAALIALLAQASIWGNELIAFWLARYQEQHLQNDAGHVMTIRAGSFVARLALFSLVILVALDNIPGVQVTALLASLGVGGIAVALAVQSVLADLFASLSIALDQPFVFGDYVAVDDYAGTVEHIGLKTTRLRAISGEQLIFSNSDLLNSRIRNYGRMHERRVTFALGLAYDTPGEKLQAVPGIVEKIVAAQPQARFGRAHLKSCGEIALDFEIVYHLLDPDYTLYMDTQQAINLGILQRFREEGIAFAYPAQRLYLPRTQDKRA